MAACLFCEIAAGDKPAAMVYADDLVAAFLDNRPLFPGHVLVVPRTHIMTLPDLPAADVGPYFLRVQAMSVAVRDAMGAQGTFVAVNNVVSQSVPHLHTHVVPRTKGDGLRGFFWPRGKYASDEEAAKVAASIRDALPGIA
jgi:histidine triad (HIT) family protein